MTQAPITGRCADRFAPLREIAAQYLESGEETGLSLAVHIDGEPVVDLYGGYRDAARTTPWTADTIVNVWSTTKTVTALAVLMLVDRGLVDIDAPVARYWPEFAAAGKENVLVRHLMSHSSGVSGWELPFTHDDMYDWEKATSHLAAQAPWWEPGTASGYHAENQGHLLGEIVRRVTGKTLKQFVAEEIAGPLDADFQIGARESDWDRCAEIIPPPAVAFDIEAAGGMDSVLVKTLIGAVPDATAPNTPAWRRADMGATNGHGNAESVARILDVVTLGGTSRGVRLLSPQTVELIFREQTHGVDLFLGIPVRFGTGFALPEPTGFPFIPEGRVCFWGGWGGSAIIMDLDRRMTISYMMNRMQPGTIGSPLAAAYTTAIYAAADQPEPKDADQPAPAL
jgi:CubicO group peptidase (beta-lactamase class C family)